MAFGKLYSYEGNARTTGLLTIAKENKLEVELVTVDTDKYPEDLAKKNPLKRIPVFEQEDGFVLTESIAIAVYFASQNEKTTLLGKSKQEYAQILKWMSFATQELLTNLAGWFRPLTGKDPYNKKLVDNSIEKVTQCVSILEQHLHESTYLVGERITLADYFVAGIAARGFENVFDAPFRSKNPNFTRWWATIANQANYTGKFAFIEEGLKNAPPKSDKAPKEKKEPKEQPKKAESKPKAPEPEDEEEEAPAPKPKHPLAALSKPTLDLDEWKRQYSNNDTRTVALPWFWNNLKTDEYSLWKINYKYNDELTQIFMTSNLIGGFFNRLEASRKYIFGAASVYGESNKSVVTGAFVIRGDEWKPAFDVAPDFESYEFIKLDPSKEEDKEFVNDQWSWDKSIEVDGQEYKHADGKVFK